MFSILYSRNTFFVLKSAVRRSRRRFLFENAWLQEVGCRDLVTATWVSSAGLDVPLRLERYSLKLKAWGGNYAKRLSRKIDNLHSRHHALSSRRDHTALLEVKAIDAQLKLSLDQYNTFWRQRAKQFWLKSGDRNTRFFHLYATARK